MKVRIRRYTRRPPDLTSLFDVMFIVVFVALIRAAAAQGAAAAPKPVVKAPPAPPAPIAALRAKALANLTSDLEGRMPVVVRVSAEGSITAIEIGETKQPLDVPLLEHSADPDAAIAYLGDRSAELRVCRIVAVHLNVPNLEKYLVIISPAVPLTDLVHALHRGLHEDILRCTAEQRAIAAIVEPSL